MMKENQSKIEKKQRQKEEEKIYNQKCSEEYSKLLDKQDEERDRLRNTIKEKYMNQTDKVKDDKAKSTSQFVEMYEENKYLKEREELDKRHKEEGDKKEVVKHEMIENMKSVLERQIEEKKKRSNLEKEYNDKFSKEVVNKGVEEFQIEKKDYSTKTKEKVEKYREELDRQLKQRELNPTMNENEKSYNKQLLNEILSSPLLKQYK